MPEETYKGKFSVKFHRLNINLHLLQYIGGNVSDGDFNPINWIDSVKDFIYRQEERFNG